MMTFVAMGSVVTCVHDGMNERHRGDRYTNRVCRVMHTAKIRLVRGPLCALWLPPATCVLGLSSVRAKLGHARKLRHYGNYGVGLAPARRCGGLGCRACVYGAWSASPRVCRPLGRPLWPWRRRRQRGQLEGVAYVGAYSQKLFFLHQPWYIIILTTCHGLAGVDKGCQNDGI